MRLLATLSLLAWLGNATAQSLQLLIQTLPLAGSQYYALAEVRPRMRTGDALTLHRETDNRHDRLAVRVDWQGRPIGYLPRAGNRVLAAALERGERLRARVGALADDPDPWRRVVVEVYLEL